MRVERTVDIEYASCVISVNGIYTPPTPMVMYYKDGSGHPGDSSDFDINEMELVSGDLFNLLDKVKSSSDYMEDIINLTIEKIENE